MNYVPDVKKAAATEKLIVKANPRRIKPSTLGKVKKVSIGHQICIFMYLSEKYPKFEKDGHWTDLSI